VTLLVLILFNAMPVVPSTGGEIVPREPTGTRGTIVVNASGGGDYTRIQWAIDNASDGDSVYVEAGTYRENVIVNNSISLLGSGYYTTILDGGGVGDVLLVCTSFVNISGFSIVNSGSDIHDAGIKLDSGNYCSIERNNCMNNSFGIYVSSSNINIIANNTCISNQYDGIYLNYTDRNFITNNTCISNNGYGIGIFFSKNHTIENNNGSYNGFGIYIYFSSNITITNNICSNNTYGDGIYLCSSDCNTLIKNTCNGNDWSGIELSWRCKNNNIVGNTFISNEKAGVNLYWSSDTNMIANNTCILNTRGISIYSSDGLTIVNNTCSSNVHSGIELYSSNRNYVTNNTCNSNNNCGISLECSLINHISNNTCFNNTNFGISISAKTQKNIVYQNKFIFNNKGGCQAVDNGTRNRWNTTEQGNFWSNWIAPDSNFDGIVDIPYNISGIANSKDYFPSVESSNRSIPIANAGDDVIIDQHQSVNFNSTGCLNRNFIKKFSWYFNYDNKPQLKYGDAPTFTFNIAGIYWVTLKVVNSLGQGTEDSMIVTVRDIIAPISKPGKDIIINQHENVIFNANRSMDNVCIVNYTWIFYDNELQTIYGVSPIYKFDNASKYVVTLKVTDAEGNWDTDTLNVTVRDITPPNPDAGPDMKINQSDIVEFFLHQNSTDNVGIENWNWTFIYDGTKQTLFHSIVMSSLPIFTFDIPGNYTVTMNVSDEAGNWAIDTLNITVLDNIVPVSDIWGEHTIDANTTFHFNSSSCWDNVAIVNWTWKFEYRRERVFLYGPDPSFRFEIPGEYQVQLIVFDAERNAESSLMTITVEPERITPGDDDLEPADNGDKGEEKDRGIMVWIWLGLAVILFTAVVVLLFFIIKSKEGGAEASGEDEMGRVGKNEGVEDEG